MDRYTINREAEFYPIMVAGELPCIQVAGAQAYLYLHADGAMRVSLFFDDVDLDTHPDWITAVPVKVDIGGTVVYEIDSRGVERTGYTLTSREVADE